MGQSIIDFLTKNLEKKLNEALAASSLNKTFDGVTFEFKIVTDTSEYKSAVRNGNSVTYYIHGLSSIVGSSKEGLEGDNFNLGASIQTEFLIPFVNKSDEGVSIMTSECRSIIDAALTASTAVTEKIDGTVYFIAATYDISRPGIRDVRPKVGDSITMSLSTEYYLVAQGISSESIKLTIDGESMFLRRIGIYRKLVSEGVIPSDAAGATKNVVSGSVLTVSFDTPVRLNSFFEKVRAYTLHGEIRPMAVTLSLPASSGEDDTETYTMIISDAGLNGELNLAASSDYTLIEYYE